jgi:hypothetical protein
MVSIRKIAFAGIDGRVLGDGEGADSSGTDTVAAVFFREGTVQV